jgi:hypothetical protein
MIVLLLLIVIICLYYYKDYLMECFTECFTERFTDDYYKTIGNSWNDINLVPKLNGKHNDYVSNDDELLKLS